MPMMERRKSESNQELEKLKSMISKLEQKNDQMMKKLDSEPKQKLTPVKATSSKAITPSSRLLEGSYSKPVQPQGRKFTEYTNKLAEKPPKQHILGASPSNYTRSPSYNKSPRKATAPQLSSSPHQREIEKLNTQISTLTEDNKKLKEEMKLLSGSLVNKNGIIKNYASKVADLTSQLEGMRKENERLMMSNQKLRSMNEAEKVALTRVNERLRAREIELGQLKGGRSNQEDIKKQIQKIIHEFSSMLESKHGKTNAAAFNKGNEIEDLKSLLTNKLKSLEKNLTELNIEAHQSLLNDYKNEEILQEDTNEDVVSRYLDYSEMKSFESSEDPLRVRERLGERLREIETKLQNLEEIQSDKAHQFSQEKQAEIKNLIEFLNMERDEIINRLECNTYFTILVFNDVHIVKQDSRFPRDESILDRVARDPTPRDQEDSLRGK